MAITDQQLEDLALAPKRTRTDEGAVTERSVEELILADQYLKGKNNAKPPHGIRISQCKPPASAT